MRPTGVALLDNVLGGLAPGFPLVLVGPTGSGRTVLCLQLAEAACQRGESVAILTGEPGRLLLRQASSMNLDLGRPLRSGQLALLELDHQVALTTRVHGGSALVDAIHQSVSECRTLLIDPLTSLTAEVLDEVGVRTLVRGIFDRTAELDQAVVVTIARERLAENTVLDSVLTEACGAFVELDTWQDGRRALQVRKSRVAGYESGPVDFRISLGGAIGTSDAGSEKVAVAATQTVVTPSAALQRARVRWSDVSDEVRASGPTDLADRSPEAAPMGGSADTAATVSSVPSVAPLLPGVGLTLDERREKYVEPGDRARILVVDDSQLARERLMSWLSEEYDVFEAGDGFAAMSAVLAHQPDLILLDLVLSRADGFEVLAALRKSVVATPVLVVSEGLLRAVNRVRALVHGAADTLPKPAQRYELMHKVEGLLRVPSPPDSGLDPAMVETLFGGTASAQRLEESAFRERLENACRFADEFGMHSALVGIETPDAAALEELVEVCGRVLWAEDAACTIGIRRSLLLLLATDLEMIPHILSRFQGALGESHGSQMKGYRWHAELAQPVNGDRKPWDHLFKRMTRWPTGG